MNFLHSYGIRKTLGLQGKISATWVGHLLRKTTNIRLIKVCFNVHLLYKFNHFHFIKVRVGRFHLPSGEGPGSTKFLAQHHGAAFEVITDIVYIYIDFHSAK